MRRLPVDELPLPPPSLSDVVAATIAAASTSNPAAGATRATRMLPPSRCPEALQNAAVQCAVARTTAPTGAVPASSVASSRASAVAASAATAPRQAAMPSASAAAESGGSVAAARQAGFGTKQNGGGPKGGSGDSIAAAESATAPAAANRSLALAAAPLTALASNATAARERAERLLIAAIDGSQANKLLRGCRASARALNRQDLAALRVISQVEAKFIAARLGTELLVFVDQHAAGERVELERLQRRVAVERMEAAPVVGPAAALPMAPEEAEWLRKHRGHLERWGFRYTLQCGGKGGGVSGGVGGEPVGAAAATSVALVTHVPEVLGTRLVATDIKAFAAEVAASDGGTSGFSGTPQAVLHILAFKACRRAVKFGDTMLWNDMTRLLSSLAACDFPFQCAHGRPTLYPVFNLASLGEVSARLQEAGAWLPPPTSAKRRPPLVDMLGPPRRPSDPGQPQSQFRQ